MGVVKKTTTIIASQRVGAKRRPMPGSAKQSIEAAKKGWIASAYAQGRFGGHQARHSSHSERGRVVAYAPCANASRLSQAMTDA